MKPQGRLLIIGGAEDKGGNDAPDIKEKNKDFEPFEILGELLPENRTSNTSIEVITAASEYPKEMGDWYVKSFKNIGYQNVGHMQILSPMDASDDKLVRRIQKAHAVLMSGGDQFRLASTLGGSKVLEAITQRYLKDKDFILAGTSAGAMVMSHIMIYGGETNEAMLKSSVKLTSGFDFIKNCIVDTHFVKRGRFGRLTEAVLMNRTMMGIGLGEDTALIIRNGDEAECRGSGMVTIIDAQNIGYTNIVDIADGRPISAENLIVHLLSRGDKISILERKFIHAKVTQSSKAKA